MVTRHEPTVLETVGSVWQQLSLWAIVQFNVRSRNETCDTEEHAKGRTEIKPDIEGCLKQKQFQRPLPH
jgi:hypothetical protein